MEEIRFHGRGGQGAVIGSEVLAHAFFIEDKFVQAFPAFGVERRGAPVLSFCRVDEKPIHHRCQIYEPDHVIVLDSSLLDSVDVTQGLREHGTVLINGKKGLEYYRDTIDAKYAVYVVNAGAIAVQHRLGSPANPIVNTAILGAFSKSSGLVGLEAVEQAIEEYVPVNKEDNRRAARDAYEKVSAA